MAPAVFILEVGKLGIWRRKFPSRVQGLSRRQAVKIMQNNSSTERFAGTTNVQKHFTTFPEGGGASAPSCPCLRVPMERNEVAYSLEIVHKRDRRLRSTPNEVPTCLTTITALSVVWAARLRQRGLLVGGRNAFTAHASALGRSSQKLEVNST